jgi:hypothetical protein
MKTRQVGAKLFHADGRKDMKNLTVAFRNFANEPKKVRNLRKSSSSAYSLKLCNRRHRTQTGPDSHYRRSQDTP